MKGSDKDSHVDEDGVFGRLHNQNRADQGARVSVLLQLAFS
jgi:hypothetical protein